MKNEYTIEKCKDTLTRRYNAYLTTKIITYDNREKEERIRTFFPCIDGDINKVNLVDLYFPITITHEEFKQLPEEYNKAWIKGTLTKTMCEKMQKLVLLMRDNKRKIGDV